jgi:hypothetical protein
MNKALITNTAKTADLGCHFDKKPFKVAEIFAWIGECTERVNLAEIS